MLSIESGSIFRKNVAVIESGSIFCEKCAAEPTSLQALLAVLFVTTSSLTLSCMGNRKRRRCNSESASAFPSPKIYNNSASPGISVSVSRPLKVIFRGVKLIGKYALYLQINTYKLHVAFLREEIVLALVLK